jgi:hypothetical protein
MRLDMFRIVYKILCHFEPLRLFSRAGRAKEVEWRCGADIQENSPALQVLAT